MPSRGVPRGGGKSNVIRMGDKTKLTQQEISRAAKIQRVKTSPAAKAVAKRVGKVKNSRFVEDVNRGNLDNFKSDVLGKKAKPMPKPRVTKKNNSLHGPVASGLVKPKPRPMPKPPKPRPNKVKPVPMPKPPRKKS